MAKQTYTLNDMFALYVADLVRRNRKTVGSIESFYNNNIKGEMGHKKLTRIKRIDVVKLFNSITDAGTPAKANRFLKILSAVYNLAIEHELVATNVCARIRKNRDVERKRYCSKEELQRIFEVLKDKENNHKNNKPSIAFIKLLIYTGARKSEIAKARWKDLQGDTIVLEEHKTDDKDDARKIFLDDNALDVINSLERKGDNVKIIGVTYIDNFWKGVSKKANCKNLRLHDLRHNFASYAYNHGLTLAEIGTLLGHKSLQSTKRYSHESRETTHKNVNIVGNEISKSINEE